MQESNREPAPADPFAGIVEDLDLLAGLPPAEQVPVFARVHNALTSALNTTAGNSDSAGPRPPGGR